MLLFPYGIWGKSPLFLRQQDSNKRTAREQQESNKKATSNPQEKVNL
jgi:hypothetical protein